MSTNPVLIVDNGAHTIKAGFSNSPLANMRKIYNAAIRSKGDKHLYIGHEFEKCKDYASLNYRLAFEKGYLTDWDVQKAVWDGLFGPEVFSLDFQSTTLLMTEPPFNLHGLQEKYDQLVFEEYEFASYLRCPTAALVPHGSLFSDPTSPALQYPECSLIVDSGFSFTHIVPLMEGKILWNGVRRIDVGGKLLTNHLSTLVSFRQWNMLDQIHIVNDVKEKCCYVSSTFSNDLERCQSGGNGMTLQYVLPDFSRNRHGYVRGRPVPPGPRKQSATGDDSIDAMKIDENIIPHPAGVADAHSEDISHEQPAPSDSDQILYMINERFTVPELLFNPSDIGLAQSGLPQTIAHSINSLPPDLQGMFWENIGLVGGNTKFPGFGNRLRQDLRSFAPVEYQVGVYESNNPTMEVYRSGHALANSQGFPSLTITREEYNEGGTNACRRKFRQFDWDPIKEKTDEASRAARRERDKGKSKVIEESDGNESEEGPKKKKKTARKAVVKKVEKRATASTISRPRREVARGS